MTTIVEARYLEGKLILPQPLPLPENALVHLTIEMVDPDLDDAGRRAWLRVSEEGLRKVWDNPGDDVFDELLAK